MNTEVIQEHRRELAAGQFPVYRLFDLLDSHDTDRETRTAVAAQVALLVDQLLFQELKVCVDRTCRTAEKLLELPRPLVVEAFRSWRITIERGASSRKAMRTTVYRFGDWVGALRPPAQQSALRLLPGIAPVIADLKEDGVTGILRIVDRAASEEARSVVIAAVTAYGSTTGPIVSGCCRIAGTAVRQDRAAELSSLIETVRVADMEESIDSERLVPAIAGLCDLCGAIGKDAWTGAFDLALLIAEENHGSAYKTARKLTRLIPSLEPPAVPAYLSDFCSLVSTVGLRTVGFAVNRLPGFYARYGAAKTGEYIRAAAGITKAHGTAAAERFLEGKTAASRNFLATPM